jgi:uncharacterized protein with HEPN domain
LDAIEPSAPWLKIQGIDDDVVQPYSGDASRQASEIYSRIALADAAVPSAAPLTLDACTSRSATDRALYRRLNVIGERNKVQAMAMANPARGGGRD